MRVGKIRKMNPVTERRGTKRAGYGTAIVRRGVERIAHGLPVRVRRGTL